MEQKQFKDKWLENLKNGFRTTLEESTDFEKYAALSKTVMDELQDEWMVTERKNRTRRNAYYFSAEFLIGRSLGNNLLNLGIFDDVVDILNDMGVDFRDLEEQEEDAALGNGGLGRLAACFIESAATEGLPLQGYGVRYSEGIFKQKFVDGFQVEEGDNWTWRGDFWSIRKDSDAKVVSFRDHSVLAVPYDMPVVGYKNGVINTLRLWQSEAIDGGFRFDKFNNFEYDSAVRGKNEAEDITRVLYPNDIQRAGKLLRLKQQYFFVSASVQDLLEKHLKNYPEDKKFEKFAEKHIIQLNDTHPVMAIPEMLRLLIDVYGLNWDESYGVVEQCFAFTNHTVLQEALEKWSLDLIDEVNPRCKDMIVEIDRRMVEYFEKMEMPQDRIASYRIVRNNLVEMAYLAVWVCQSVNGVAEIHTNILINDTFRNWYELFPKKFNNKTNGVTPRRWLQYANPELSSFITKHLGSEAWHHDLTLLKGLEKYKDDEEVLKELNDIKHVKKEQLAKYIKKVEGVQLNPDAIFDIQIKRLHEYKRQLLNALHIVYLYNQIKKNPDFDMVPRVFIFGAKAAPGYFRAKAIIKFINEISALVNNDPIVSRKMKVVFIQNYRVSYAEKLFPACDVSEQISTAGKEASGTGNMKFMMNATPTLGTYDGANVEIFREAGEENNYRFGATVEELAELRNHYNSKDYYYTNPELKKAVDILISEHIIDDNGTYMFLDIYNELVSPQHGGRADTYFVLKDFESYRQAQERIDHDYRDRMLWARKCLMNLANSGYFSSDRTIREYAKDIWDIKPI